MVTKLLFRSIRIGSVLGYESYTEISSDRGSGSYSRWDQLDIFANGRYFKRAKWGRVAEGSGEDPYLGSEIAKAMVYGYQGMTYQK